MCDPPIFLSMNIKVQSQGSGVELGKQVSCVTGLVAHYCDPAIVGDKNQGWCEDCHGPRIPIRTVALNFKLVTVKTFGQWSQSL